MMPLVETAASTPPAPDGANPFAAVKLLVWKPPIASTTIVSTGMATFHHVATLFVLASWRTLEEVDRGEDRHQHHGGDDAASPSARSGRR